MNLKEKYKRVLRPTTSMTVTITYSSDGRLSFVGTGRHGSGQVYEYLTDGTPAEGYTRESCFQLQRMWKRWHLNDMRAGTPKQEEAVRNWRKTAEDKGYEAACKMLESIGLLVDGGYRYGSRWLKEEVPLEVIEWLFSLPGDGSSFSDVYTPEINQNEFEAILAAIGK